MVHPDVMAARLDADVVPAIRVVSASRIEDPKIAEFQVANDDVVLPSNPQRSAADRRANPRIDRLVGVDEDFTDRVVGRAVNISQRRAIDIVHDLNPERPVGLAVLNELSKGRDLHMLSARATRGAVLPKTSQRGKSNQIEIGSAPAGNSTKQP